MKGAIAQPVNPATNRPGPRWCIDCGAELQVARERIGFGYVEILRCPWTRAGERLALTMPAWFCRRPYVRSARDGG